MIIEAEIISYLKEKGFDVYAERPTKLPARYVLVERTGGSRSNTINQSMIAVQSISNESLLEAAELNESVKEAIYEMPSARNVYKAQLNSDYNYTNTTTKEYRYQAVFNFYY